MSDDVTRLARDILASCYVADGGETSSRLVDAAAWR
jgi:hypothetical protein